MINFFQHFFLKIDPKVQAFNLFYSDMLKSNFLEYSSIIQDHPTLCYNLMSKEDGNLVKSYLKNHVSGYLLDFGCGCPYSPHLINQNTIIEGLDFSEVAIMHARKLYPMHKFKTHHLNILPNKKYDHVLITDALYQSRDLQRDLNRILKKTKNSLYLVQNFNEGPPFLQNKRTIIQSFDTTQSFKMVCLHWSKTLQEVKEQKFEANSIFWNTFKKELAIHLKNIENPKFKRLHLIISKSNS